MSFSSSSAILHRVCSVPLRRASLRASHQLLLPSSDVRLRARSPWACLTQHLPLSSFLNSSGICFSHSFRPYFMPLPLIGFSPSEFFPHATARRPLPARCPLGLSRQRQVWSSILKEANTQHLSMPLSRSKREWHECHPCLCRTNRPAAASQGAVVRCLFGFRRTHPRLSRWDTGFSFGPVRERSMTFAHHVLRGASLCLPERSTRRLFSPTGPRRGQRIGAVYVVTSRSRVEWRVNRLLLWRRGLAAFRALLHRCVRTMSRFPAASPILSWRFPFSRADPPSNRPVVRPSRTPCRSMVRWGRRKPFLAFRFERR